MSLIIQKYGGTSVATIEKIKNIAENIKSFVNKNNKLVVVVSAMAGDTNKLLNFANEISNNPNKRDLDVLATAGEQVSTALLSIALNNMGIKSKSYCAWQIPIITNNDFTQARIKKIDDTKILNDLKNNYVIIIAGFQGINENNDITSLGRGGSDISALAIGVTLNANECQIYTDVNGIYNVDPNKYPFAKRIDVIDGVSILEASSLGAKVLHARSCELAYRYKLNIRVMSSFFLQDQGTLVMNNKEIESYPITNLSMEEDQVLFVINDVNISKILEEIYSITTIDMVTINNRNISFVTNNKYFNEIKSILDKLNIKNFKTTHDLVKFSLIGSGFRSNKKLNQHLWKTLNGFEIFSITHNEISISILVHKWDDKSIQTNLMHFIENYKNDNT